MNKPTKNERREQAREQARLAREAEKRREKRRRLTIQGSVVLGVIVVLGIVGLVLSQTLKPAGPGPENMASGGVVFTENLDVVATAPLADPTGQREAVQADRASLPIDMSVYVDYKCPHCASFEQQYGGVLETYVGSGDVQMEVYPVTFMDPQSGGTKYSTRAANLLGCVVEQQPEFAFALHNRLLAADVQPQGATGLTDEELVEVAESAGATADSELKQCINDQRFRTFFGSNYTSINEHGVPGLAEGAQLIDGATGQLQDPDGPQTLSSTPTIIINGQQWDEVRDGELEQYILKLKGEIEQQGGASADDEAETEEDSE